MSTMVAIYLEETTSIFEGTLKLKESYEVPKELNDRKANKRKILD